MKPEFTVFPVNDLLRALGREFEPAARAKGLRLSIVPSPLAIRSDRRLLRRVLQNLLSNAIKYTPKGRVVMGCRRQGSHLRIEVHDSGPGIPLAQQKLVFREFERLARNKGHEPGLGLGLSIVERMCKVMKHPLALKSDGARGTVFWVTVPAAAAIDKVTPDTTVPLAPAARLKGLKVLVIDNEATIVDGMTGLLQGWGVEVTGALSAAEAIAAQGAARIPFDVILADYHIHREDGIALVEAIRARAGRPIPAVLITADRSKAVQDLAAAADIQYLRKPVKPAALRASLSHAMARAEAAE